MKTLKFYYCTSLRTVWQLNNKCTYKIEESQMLNFAIFLHVAYHPIFILLIKKMGCCATCCSPNNIPSCRSLGLHLVNLIEVSDEILQSCDQNNRMDLIILPLTVYVCSLGTVRMIQICSQPCIPEKLKKWRFWEFDSKEFNSWLCPSKFTLSSVS